MLQPLQSDLTCAHKVQPLLAPNVQVEVQPAVVVQQEVAHHVDALDGVGVGPVSRQEPGVVLLRRGPMQAGWGHA